LKEFKFTNPHSWMVVTVTDGKGISAEWTIEGLSPGALAAKRVKRSAFKSGDKIVVTLNPNWAFDTLGWQQVIHTISPQNTASQAVARKLGAHNWGPGRLPPPLHEIPVDVWGQSREQWRARPYRSSV
jgi:hypothetical protein